jgi:hypothetical protein
MGEIAMSFSQSRRQLGFACSVVIAFAGINNVIFSAGAEQLEPASKVRVEWQVAKDQADDVKKVLPLAQTATSDTVSIFVGAALVPELAQAVINVYSGYKNGGATIDARGEPIIVQTNDRVAAGSAVIITVNESKLVRIRGAERVTLDVLSGLLAAAVKK